MIYETTDVKIKLNDIQPTTEFTFEEITYNFAFLRYFINTKKQNVDIKSQQKT